MGKPEPLLQDIFTVSGDSFSVFLFQNCLNWCPQKKGGQDMSEWMLVKLGDILSVDLSLTSEKGSPEGCCTLNPLSPRKKKGRPSHHLLIQFAIRKKNSDNWRVESLALGHRDTSLLSKWQTALRSKLNELKYRPKNLLFFVNPYGGKRKAPSIFESGVKPLLLMAGVQFTVVSTQRRNHATEVLVSMPPDRLAEFDVVVGVGGDGTICEVASGLLFRSLKGSQSDESQLEPSPLPIGVIPAGSSNALAYSLHGTEDPITATIHLILGGNVPLDIGAIHGASGISRFIVGQLSYGHLADTVYYSEKLRWMGPKRYDYAGFRKFLGHSTYEGSVEMLLAKDSGHKLSICGGGGGCIDCELHDTEDQNKGDSNEKQWKRVDGNFIGISGAIVSCRCALTPMGLAPFAHISDGHLDLILIRKASRLNHLKYLLRTASGDSRTAFALPFVERYRVKEFVFYPSQICDSKGSINNGNENEGMCMGSSSPMVCGSCETDEAGNKKIHSKWNCDGELYHQPSLRVTVHSNLIRIMARSRPDLKVNYFNSPNIPNSLSASSTETCVSNSL